MAETKEPADEPAYRIDVYATDEGDFVLRWPANASAVLVTEFEDWANLMIRKVKRVLLANSYSEIWPKDDLTYTPPNV